MDNQEKVEQNSYRVFTTNGIFIIQASNFVYDETSLEIQDDSGHAVAIIPMDTLYAIIDNKAFVSYHVE